MGSVQRSAERYGDGYVCSHIYLVMCCLGKRQPLTRDELEIHADEVAYNLTEHFICQFA
jgi:hypothetical protein